MYLSSALVRLAAPLLAFLVEEGRQDVLMIDAGAQLSEKPGQHLKNAFVYQRDIDRFTPVVQALELGLHTDGGRIYPESRSDSVPSIARRYAAGKIRGRIRPGTCLPRQSAMPFGGMFTHWTCNAPRHHPELEQIRFIPDAEWDVLYAKAESLFDVHTDVFSHSLRHRAVKELSIPLRRSRGYS